MGPWHVLIPGPARAGRVGPLVPFPPPGSSHSFRHTLPRRWPRSLRSHTFASSWLPADVGLGRGSFSCPAAVSPAGRSLPGPGCRSGPSWSLLGRADPELMGGCHTAPGCRVSPALGCAGLVSHRVCVCVPSLRWRLLQLLPPHHPVPAAGAEVCPASSLFRERPGPWPPGVQQRSVFLSSRPLHGCQEIHAHHSASAFSCLFWAGPGSIAATPVCGGAGLPSRPGWPPPLLEAPSRCLCPGSHRPRLRQHPQGAGSRSGQAGLARMGNGRPVWMEGLVSSPTSPCPGSTVAPALPSCFPALAPAEVPAPDESPGGCGPQLRPGGRRPCCCCGM